MIQMSGVPVEGSSRHTATRLPSGERRGPRHHPAKSSRGPDRGGRTRRLACRARRRDGAIGEHAVARRRERCIPGRSRTAHASHALRDRYRLPRSAAGFGWSKAWAGERRPPARRGGYPGSVYSAPDSAEAKGASSLLPDCSDVYFRRGSLFSFRRGAGSGGRRAGSRAIGGPAPRAGAVSGSSTRRAARGRRLSMRGEIRLRTEEEITPPKLQVPP